MAGTCALKAIGAHVYTAMALGPFEIYQEVQTAQSRSTKRPGSRTGPQYTDVPYPRTDFEIVSKNSVT